MDALLPQKLIPVIIRLSGIDARKKVNSVTKEERKRLVGLLKALPLTITGTTGYNEAVVTCGGIQVNEIDPATMESKFVKQLHFAGEVLEWTHIRAALICKLHFPQALRQGMRFARNKEEKKHETICHCGGWACRLRKKHRC